MNTNICGYQIIKENSIEPVLISIETETGIIKDIIRNPEKEKFQIDYEFDEQVIIFPGLIDLHIHAREDQTQLHCYKETYKTALQAALNGGVTHVCAMPNTPNPLTCAEDLQWHEDQIKNANQPVTIQNYIGIGKNTVPIDKKKQIYKLYVGPSVGPLFFKNEKEIDQSLQKYNGENISFHVEDFLVLQENENQKYHFQRRPVECVDTALDYILPLIEKHQIQAKLCHWSLGEDSFKKIQIHKEKMDKLNLGYNTTIEVSPMHLLFDTDMLKENPNLWPLVQMNPSIQNQQMRLDLIKGLKNKFIDYLATDHAPHTLNEKYKQFEDYKKQNVLKSNKEAFELLKNTDLQSCHELCIRNGTSGATWLDTYALVLGILHHQHDFTYEDLLRVASYNPAKFIKPYLNQEFGLGMGQIAVGHLGNLTLLNFNKTTVIDNKNLQTKTKWSPLEGKKIQIGIEAIFIKGKKFNSSHFST